MKIDCLSYFNPFKSGGGGEMVTRGLIEEGRRRGHHIRLRTVRPFIDEGTGQADLYWLVDIFNFPHTLKSRGAWHRFPNSLLRDIGENRPFIHMSNAYADVCNLGHLPCSGQAQVLCQHKSPTRFVNNLAIRDFGRRCFALDPLVRSLYERSVMNVYVSPLHQQVIEGILGKGVASKAYVLKPLIDDKLFFD